MLRRDIALVLELEHGNGVDVVGVAASGSGHGYALVILTGHLAGGGPLALRPVTHDLHAGLAVDHLGSGEVPVATRTVVVHVTGQLLQRGEHLGHLRAGKGRLVILDERLVVAIGAHDAQHQGFENCAVLPGLTTVSQGHETGSLELVAGGIKFLEGGGRLVDSGLLEHLRIDPQPIDAVDVHRHRHVMAVVLHGVGDGLRQQTIPVIGLGHLIERAQKIERAPLLQVGALDLCGAWRIAGDHAGFQHGHGRGTGASGDGTILPGEAVLLDQVFQDLHRSGFATGCPPVDHFDGALGGSGQCGKRKQRGERNDSGKASDRVHSSTFSCFYTGKPAACVAWILGWAITFGGNEGMRVCHHVVTQRPERLPGPAPEAGVAAARPDRRDKDPVCPARCCLPAGCRCRVHGASCRAADR